MTYTYNVAKIVSPPPPILFLLLLLLLRWVTKERGNFNFQSSTIKKKMKKVKKVKKVKKKFNLYTVMS